MVWGSRSNSSTVDEAVQPCASSSMAYHLLSLPKGPFPGRWRQNHPAAQGLGIHLPLFQKPVHLPHAHHQPLATPKTS